MNNRSIDRRRGRFTLVELLVVIGIIAIVNDSCTDGGRNNGAVKKPASRILFGDLRNQYLDPLAPNCTFPNGRWDFPNLLSQFGL